MAGPHQPILRETPVLFLCRSRRRAHEKDHPDYDARRYPNKEARRDRIGGLARLLSLERSG